MQSKLHSKIQVLMRLIVLFIIQGCGENFEILGLTEENNGDHSDRSSRVVRGLS